MKVSIVIPTFNRRGTLARILPTVFDQSFPADQREVVVVIDGSTDDTAGLLRGLTPPCELRVIEQANRGPAAARNAGLLAARGEIVLFLDDDILCGPALVGAHVAAHAAIGETALVFGLVNVAPESPDTLAAQWVRREAKHCAALMRGQRKPLQLHEIWIGPNCSAPRALFAAHGGYDERLRTHEDAELAIRLWSAGVGFVFEPDAVVHQLYVKAAKEAAVRDAARHGRSQIMLCRKHPRYRPHASLVRRGLDDRPFHERLLIWLAGRLPVSPEPLLRPPYWIAERLKFITWFRRFGVRVLQRRMATETLRAAVEEAGSWRSFRDEFGMRLPVLLYHHVGPPAPGVPGYLRIAPEKFERQVRWLARHGYKGVRASDWAAWCREASVFPRRAVLFSFDDAYADIATYALPVLEKYGFGAVVFVPSAYIGGTNVWDEARGTGTLRLMTETQISQWAGRGIEFGSHGRTHRALAGLPSRELEQEIVGSREELARVAGAPVRLFAYPYGLRDEGVVERLRSAYEMAFTSEPGINYLGTDPCLCRRSPVQPDDTLLDLRSRLRTGQRPSLHMGLRSRGWNALWQVRVGEARNWQSLEGQHLID
jgi:peptidoglycan/xylan/chitin deacetylase (PgdA/CDA1 family)/glycosyltransferase involved in cell wall biosynthesis